jgi:hypothetical protein
MFRVLMNLARNAIQAMSGGGAMTLTAECGPDGVVMDFGDNGPGLPEKARAHLFEAFTGAARAGAGGRAGLRRPRKWPSPAAPRPSRPNASLGGLNGYRHRSMAGTSLHPPPPRSPGAMPLRASPWRTLTGAIRIGPMTYAR